MKSGLVAFKLSAVAIGVALLNGCTSNPFGGDDISPGTARIQGTVLLNDASSPEGAYVWLEGFKLGTRTDSRGKFQLTLPPPSAQGSAGGVSGTFNLYFYIANYQLDIAQVVTQNGEFVYGRGDLNGKGELTKLVIKFLHILTEVAPSSVPVNHPFRIGVQVTLEATTDSATVVFPSSVGGLLGAILFRNVETGQVSTLESVAGGPSDIQIVGRAPYSRVLAFNVNQLRLAPGEYEIIPYLLMAHETLPDGLLDSISPDVQELGPDYLKIPFRREGGRFTVTN